MILGFGVKITGVYCSYIITRCVDYRGNLDVEQLRRDGVRYPTRLKQGEAIGHSDLHCIDDMEQTGLIVNLGTRFDPVVKLTEKGWAIASKLQQHKANGGNYGDFEVDGLSMFHFRRLSVLSGIVEDQKIQQLDKLLLSLSHTNNLITAPKVAMALTVSSNAAKDVLSKCREEGLLSVSYGLRCPECGLLIKRLEDVKDIPSEAVVCYSCENEVVLSAEGIEELYSTTA